MWRLTQKKLREMTDRQSCTTLYKYKTGSDVEVLRQRENQSLSTATQSCFCSHHSGHLLCMIRKLPLQRLVFNGLLLYTAKLIWKNRQRVETAFFPITDEMKPKHCHKLCKESWMTKWWKQMETMFVLKWFCSAQRAMEHTGKKLSVQLGYKHINNKYHTVESWETVRSWDEVFRVVEMESIRFCSNIPTLAPIELNLIKHFD